MKSWKKEFLKEWWDKNLDHLPLGAKYRGLWQQGQVRRMIKELDERLIDIQVAQQVFGYMVNVKEETHYLEYGGDVYYPELMYLAEVYDDGSGERWELLPHYSTDIKDAFLIVDHLKMDIGIAHSAQEDYTFCVYEDNYFSSKTIPLGICTAALKK